MDEFFGIKVLKVSKEKHEDLFSKLTVMYNMETGIEGKSFLMDLKASNVFN